MLSSGKEANKVTDSIPCLLSRKRSLGVRERFCSTDTETQIPPSFISLLLRLHTNSSYGGLSRGWTEGRPSRCEVTAVTTVAGGGRRRRTCHAVTQVSEGRLREDTTTLQWGRGAKGQGQQGASLKQSSRNGALEAI